jgi:UDP-glucose 4-epimerase
VIAKFIKRAMRGEVLEIYGDGAQTRDFIYVEDLTRAVRLAATAEGVGGEVFQIATNAETSVQEMVEELLPILAAVGIKDVEVKQAAPRLGDVMRNYSDTSKAARTLGWRAEVCLKEGLRCTVNWFMDQSGGR